jgi:DNA invertase Pin-like site-specific DNA recombinase
MPVATAPTTDNATGRAALAFSPDGRPTSRRSYDHNEHRHKCVTEAEMAEGKWVSYLRVSTDKQGATGLGIEAQRAGVTGFLNGGDWTLLKEFVEVESGAKSDRPQLNEALRICRLYGAKLVIARLDRLSRDAHFLLGLEKAGVDFVAADMPNANRLTVGIMGMVAELAQAKARGTKLGGDRGTVPTARARAQASAAIRRHADERAADILPAIRSLQEGGCASLHTIAAGLNAQGIPTTRGTGTWRAAQVARVLKRA